MSKAVKKVAATVAGAVIGFAVGGGPWGAIQGAMAGYALYASTEKLDVGSPLRDNEPSAQTVRSAKAPARYILGRVSTGGVFAWVQEEAGAQNVGEWVHLVYVLSEGAIAGVDEIYLGEELIATYGADVTHEVIIDPAEVNAFLLNNCPDWKNSQIGRGLSFVRISLRYTAEKFPSGIPEARFVVRGRTDVYDPRSGVSGYSDNTALHLLWFLRNRCGVPDDEIIFETFASSANVCDETVTNPDGSTSKRYTTGCVIGADEKRASVIEKLEQSCAGKLIRVGGKWSLQVGAYYGPADFEITEDMIIGTVAGTSEGTTDSAINTVRGTFPDPSQAWAETDYPEVAIQDWLIEDGGEAAETMSYSYVHDVYQVQRLANIELRRRRAGGAISLPLNFNGYNARPGRVVRVNLPSLNIVGECIVSDWTMSAADACNVTVSQYEAAIFDDAVGEPYEPLGFINLPTGGMAAPTNLQWSVETDAEVVQGVLSWSPPSSMVEYYKVTVRQAGKVAQALTVPSTATQCYINGLDSGAYTMGVSAKGPMALSGETTLSVNIDGPPVPESCAVFAGNLEITLVPSNIQNRLNGGTYEYFYALTADVPPAQAEYLGQGLSFSHTGLGFSQTYFYYIRSVNAYGRSGFLAVPATTSSEVRPLLDALKGEITETEVGQHLLDRIDLIDGDGPGSVNDRLEQLADALLYDPEETYSDGDIVRAGQRLYQAIGDVPANTPPPNAEHWADIGQILDEAGGIALQIDEIRQEISAIDGRLEVVSEKTDGVFAQINPPLAGDTGWQAGSEEVLAGVWSIQSAFASEDLALAQKIDATQAQVGDSVAIVEQVSKAQAEQDGKLSAMWSVKLGLTENGLYYGAGMGVGIENTPDGMQSQILFQADRFAFFNNVDGKMVLPVVIQGGQIILNSAIIGDASIGTAKLERYLDSSNYVPQVSGLRLDMQGGIISLAADGVARTIAPSYDRMVDTTTGVTFLESGVLE